MCNFFEIYFNIFLVCLEFYVTVILKKISIKENKISVGSFTLMSRLVLNCSLVANSHLFVFCIYLLVFILVYHFESHEYVSIGICRSLFHNFNLVLNMRFAVEIIFYTIQF